MVDETTEATDARIATHIVNVHRYQQSAFDVPYDTESLQHYIRYARAIKPEVTPEVRPAPIPRSYCPSDRAPSRVPACCPLLSPRSRRTAFIRPATTI